MRKSEIFTHYTSTGIYCLSYKQSYFLYGNNPSQFRHRSMRYGDHHAVRGYLFQCLQDGLLGFHIQVRGDLIQKKKFRVRCCRPGDGEQLPLSLGEQLRRALRIVAVLHLHNVLVQAGQNRGPLHRFHGNVFIKQRDPVFDCARHPVEGLLHIAEQLYKKSLQILILCGSEAQ